MNVPLLACVFGVLLASISGAAAEPIPARPDAPTSAQQQARNLGGWREALLEPIRARFGSMPDAARVEAFVEAVCLTRAYHRNAPIPGMLVDASTWFGETIGRNQFTGDPYLAVLIVSTNDASEFGRFNGAEKLERSPELSGVFEAERLRLLVDRQFMEIREFRDGQTMPQPLGVVGPPAPLSPPEPPTEQAATAIRLYAAWLAHLGERGRGDADVRFMYEAVRPAFSVGLVEHGPSDLIESLIKAAAVIDPWLGEMCAGERDAARGWGEHAATNSKSPQGREERVKSHMVAARSHFEKALVLQPKRPEPPTALIRLARAGCGPDLGLPREWFDRAVAIEMDWGPAYRAMQHVWRHSTEKAAAPAIEFAQECFATGRTDTRVPLYGIEMIIPKVWNGGGPTPWKHAGLYVEARTALMLYTTIPDDPLAMACRNHLVAIAYVNGHLDEARKERSFKGFRFMREVMRLWVYQTSAAEFATRTPHGPTVEVAALPIPKKGTAPSREAWTNRSMKLWRELLGGAWYEALPAESPERAFADAMFALLSDSGRRPSTRMIEAMSRSLMPADLTKVSPELRVLRAHVLGALEDDDGAEALFRSMSESMQGWWNYRRLAYWALAEQKRGAPRGSQFRVVSEAESVCRSMEAKGMFDARFAYHAIGDITEEGIGDLINLDGYGPLSRIADMDPWLREMLWGDIHVTLAWKARGGGWASEVRDSQWVRFRDELAIAREHYLTALDLAPDRPEPCHGLIRIAGMGNLPGVGTARQWLDRAMSIEVDAQVFEPYLTSLLPRWGGSHEEMVRFAQECAASGRFDSGLPYEVIRVARMIVWDTDDRTSPWKVPGMYEAVRDAMLGCIRAGEHDAMYERNSLAAIAVLAGHPEQAAELVNAPGWRMLPEVAVEWLPDPAALERVASGHKTRQYKPSAIPAAPDAPTAAEYREQLLKLIDSVYVQPRRDNAKKDVVRPQDIEFLEQWAKWRAGMTDALPRLVLAERVRRQYARLPNPRGPLGASVATGTLSSLRSWPEATRRLAVAAHASDPWARMEYSLARRQLELHGFSLLHVVSGDTLNKAMERLLAQPEVAEGNPRAVYALLTQAARRVDYPEQLRARIAERNSKPKPLSPWLTTMLLADCALAEAEVISKGDPTNLTGLPLSKFGSARLRALAEFEAAWDLDPSRPESAAEACRLAGQALEDPGLARMWFDRAVALESDFLPAFEALRDALAGDPEALAKFLVECVGTERFDTLIPAFSLELVEAIEQCDGVGSPWLQDRVYGRVLAMIRGYASHGPPQLRDYFLSVRIGVAARLGNWQHVFETVSDPRFELNEPTATAWLIPHDGDAALSQLLSGGPATGRDAIAEAFFRRTKHVAATAEADELLRRHRTKEALETYQAIAATAEEEDSRARIPIERRVRLASLLSQFESGEETKLDFDESFTLWRAIDGLIEGHKDGSGTLFGTDALCLHLGDFGPRFEAWIEINTNGFSESRTGENVVSFHCQPGKTPTHGAVARVQLGSTPNLRVGKGRPMNFSAWPVTKFHLQFFDGQFAIDVNGDGMMLVDGLADGAVEEPDDPEGRAPASLCITTSRMTAPLKIKSVRVSKLDHFTPVSPPKNQKRRVGE